MHVRNKNNFLRPGELSCKRSIYSRVFDIRNSTRNKLSLSLIKMWKTHRALIHVQTELLPPRWAGLMQIKHVQLVIYIYSRFVSSRRRLWNLWCLLEEAVTVSVSLIDLIKLWGRIKEIYWICLLEWAFKTGFSCENFAAKVFEVTRTAPSSMSSVGLTRLDSSLNNFNHRENTHNGSYICPGLRRLPPEVSKILLLYVRYITFLNSTL